MSAYLQAIRLREEGWHGQGFELGGGFIEDGETPTEAMQHCGMYDYTYDYESLYRMVRQGDATINADGTMTVHNAVLQPIDKSKLAVNTPSGERIVLGRVVDWYEPLQPKDLGRILDPLAEQMQLYGVGILGRKAEIMFVQFELPPYAIHGDEHQSFVLFGDNKKQGGLYQATTHVRVVCWNTWAAAIRDLPSFGHSDTAFTAQTVARVFQASLKAQEREQEMLTAFFSRKTDKTERNEFAEAVFPDPVKPAKVELMERAQATLSETEADEVTEKFESRLAAYESGLELAAARRTHLMDEVAQFNDQMPQAADTAYALFNGATAMARPQLDVRDAEGRKMFSGDNVNRLANSFFGMGANGQAVARARQHLIELVN